MPNIYAIGDPHLSLATPGKEMDRFGPQWVGHAEKIRAACQAQVGEDDLLLIPGDLSWALKLGLAMTDLDFLAALPGTKVICRGNHDYWWQSLNKVRNALPDGMYAVGGDAIAIGKIHFCGTRLWDVPDVGFGELINWLSEEEGGVSRPPMTAEDQEKSLKIYTREVGRLQRSLKALDRLAETEGEPELRVALVHYPPCSAALEETELTKMFEAHAVDHVVFGHLHSLKPELAGTLFGEHNGVTYHLTSCDYLDFSPVRIA